VDELDDASWRELRRALGDQRMIGMSLDAGGHLTHGFRRNISGKMFDQRSYGTDPETGLIDYAQVRRLAQEFRPLIVVAGYSAYPRLLNFAIMREIADEVDATLMVDMAHFAGLVAGRVLTGDFDPVPHAQVVTPPPTSRSAARVVGSYFAKASWPSTSTAAVPWCSEARSPT
jgi:glycine hydroxymethyltransferase